MLLRACARHMQNCVSEEVHTIESDQATDMLSLCHDYLHLFFTAVLPEVSTCLHFPCSVPSEFHFLLSTVHSLLCFHQSPGSTNSLNERKCNSICLLKWQYGWIWNSEVDSYFSSACGKYLEYSMSVRHLWLLLRSQSNY